MFFFCCSCENLIMKIQRSVLSLYSHWWWLFLLIPNYQWNWFGYWDHWCFIAFLLIILPMLRRRMGLHSVLHNISFGLIDNHCTNFDSQFNLIDFSSKQLMELKCIHSKPLPYCFLIRYTMTIYYFFVSHST